MRQHKAWVRGSVGVSVVAAAALLAGCSGQTMPATDITPTSAALHATASCDGTPGRPCSFRFEYQANGIRQYGPLHGPIAGSTHGPVPVTETVSDLRPATTYDAWFCGMGDNNVLEWTCANAVSFTTQPQVGGVAPPAPQAASPAPQAAPPALPVQTPPRPRPVRYVALGDSFSSGEGAYDYLPEAPGRPMWCHRSRNAYSQVLAGRLRGGLQHDPTRDFMACSGDKVAELTSRQLPGALKNDVAVITIGIGGNDAGFADILKDCALDAVLHPTAGSGKGCKRIIADAFAIWLPVLRVRLHGLYTRIHDSGARNAKVIVVGYPALFEDSYASSLCASTASLTRGARADLRAGAERLNREIAAIAHEPPFSYRFVDPKKKFKPHRVCGPKKDWINGFILGPDWGPAPETFHPNAAGQLGLADAIAAAEPGIFR